MAVHGICSNTIYNVLHVAVIPNWSFNITICEINLYILNASPLEKTGELTLSPPLFKSQNRHTHSTFRFSSFSSISRTSFVIPLWALLFSNFLHQVSDLAHLPFSFFRKFKSLKSIYVPSCLVPRQVCKKVK